MASSSVPSSTALSNMNFLRLTGLASGLDTESMVTSLMRAERVKYDRLTQKKQVMDWTRDANIEVNNLLKDFRDTYLSVLHPETSVLSSSLLSFKVTADANSSAAVTATANAQAGSHVINSITSLATGASVSSGSAVNNGAAPGTTSLGSMALTNPLDFGEDDKISFKINGETFSFDSVYTLPDIVATVNRNEKANVSMTYSSLTGKFTLTSKDLGSDSSIVIENISGNAFGEDSAFGIDAGAYGNGTDAVLNIDGVDVTMDSNSFTIDGIVYTLKNSTDTPIRFSLEQDVDGAVDKVKKFVDAYNTLVEKLQDKLAEHRDSSYQPLTDEQKEGMSETQIANWEKQVKTGLLENDRYISKLLSEMRKAFFDNVSGAGTSASALGLNTISYLTNGQINVDETKLRKALISNPQQVANALNKVMYESNPAEQYAKSGAFSRINDTINRYLDDYTGYRKDANDSLYSQLENRMTTMQRQLEAKEERYWNQFTRMEEALSRMNSQSNWLAQQFSVNS